MTDTTTEPGTLAIGAPLQLRADDPDSVFTLTQADITANITNHIDGTQELTVVLVLERPIR